MKSQARKTKNSGKANGFAMLAMKLLVGVGVTTYIVYLVYQFVLATQKF